MIALAANKCEPLKCHTAVDLNEVMNYAKDNKLIFMETSAKTAMNVPELFVTVGMYLFVSFGASVYVIELNQYWNESEILDCVFRRLISETFGYS